MIRLIVGSSLKFRFLVIAAAAGLIFFGTHKLQNMPIDVFPEFAPPTVEIQTPSLGLSPQEVEELVTVPIEDALAGVPGLDVLRSKSVQQLSSVKLIFEPGTDLLNARQVVSERMELVTPNLPTWAAPPVILPPLSATSRTVKVGISSKTLSVIDLSMITYWKIRAKLLGIRGVANVAIWGERIEMTQVQVEPERLKANNVTLNQVMEGVGDTLDAGLLRWTHGSHIGTGGWIETPNQRLGIRHVFGQSQKDVFAGKLHWSDFFRVRQHDSVIADLYFDNLSDTVGATFF